MSFGFVPCPHLPKVMQRYPDLARWYNAAQDQLSHASNPGARLGRVRRALIECSNPGTWDCVWDGTCQELPHSSPWYMTGLVDFLTCYLWSNLELLDGGSIKRHKLVNSIVYQWLGIYSDAGKQPIPCSPSNTFS